MTAYLAIPVPPGPAAPSARCGRLAVLYAAREGPARRVAMRVANTLRARGATVDLEDVVHAPCDVSLRHYAAVVIVASVCRAPHDGVMIDFVAAHRRELDDVHTAFLSVSASEAGAEALGTPLERGKEEADANAMIEAFCAETGWRPERIRPVAGAPRYSQYGLAVRFLARPAANKAGGSMDAKHDVGVTDWAAVDHFVEDVSVTWLPVAMAASAVRVVASTHGS